MTTGRDLACALAVGVFAAVLYLPALGNRDLWDPNEAGYAVVASAMAESGEYLVPTTNGIARGEKPAPYYWLLVAASALTGRVDETASRLPSAVLGVLLIVLTYALARTTMARRDAVVAACVLAVAFRVAWQARWAEPDIALTFFVTAAMGLFHGAIRERTYGVGALAGAYCAIAVATLMKGPVAIAIPAAALLAYFAARREPAGLWRIRPLMGACIIVALVAPWYTAAALSGGEAYAYDLVWRQNVERFFDPFDHRRPMYFYIYKVAGDFAPFGLFVPAALAYAWRERKSAARGGAGFFVAWFAAGFAFFTLSGAKRGIYLLPLYPPAAILVGWLFAARRAGEPLPWHLFKLPAWLTCAGAAIGAAALGWFALLDGLELQQLERMFDVEEFPIALARELVLPGAIIAAVAAVSASAALAIRRCDAFPAVMISAMAVGLVYVQLWVLPRIDPYKSARAASARIAGLVGPHGRFGAFARGQARDYSDSMHVWDPYLFYARRRIDLLSRADEVGRYFAARPGAVVLMREETYESLPRDVLERVVWTEEFRVGHREMVIASNGPFARSGFQSR